MYLKRDYCNGECDPYRMSLFMQKIDRGPEWACWDWTATINGGYGMFWNGDEMVYAHRYVYDHFVGDTDPEMDIDHRCRNRACVNPHHLEQVTHRENVLRGNGLAAQQARRTHCIHGHEFTPENTLPQSMGRRGRRCRKCKNIAAREYRARKKASA